MVDRSLTNGNNTYVATEDRDTIRGLGGHDYIYGEGGIDSLYGGAGTDRLYGGDDYHNYDELEDAYSNNKADEFDELYGGSGNDYLYGGFNWDDLYGGSGHDSLYGGGGRDVLYGGQDNDLLFGNDGDFVYDLTAPNQRLDYRFDNHDELYGGSGDDILWGGLSGDSDDSRLASFNELTGGSGSDTFLVGTFQRPGYVEYHRIRDFDPDEGDVIRFLMDRADITEVSSDDSGTDLGGDWGLIHISGYTASEFDWGDFDFV